jgi:transcriptional regulator of acetoin/glycerol metabolism
MTPLSMTDDGKPTNVQQIGERAIWEAFEQAEGRVYRAARILGIPHTSLLKALDTWLAHMAPALEKLRDQYGTGETGRPVEHDIPRAVFLATWREEEHNISGVARALGVDRRVVRRLARAYGAPGAPPPRKRNDRRKG